MATTLMGDTTSADVWMRGLRDGDTGVWSRPVRSPHLDAAYAAVHGGSGQPFPDDPLMQQQPGAPGAFGGSSSRDSSPKLKRSSSVKVPGAVEAEGDLRAVGLCQKPTAVRTQEDIKFIQSFMCSLSFFFSLWPAPLQWELARLMSAHILARREVALTRGKPPDRLYFVVSGRLDVRLPVPTPGGGREERTLAVLTRGHTVGEAVLLGSQAQHTTVVVSSSSAMLLSLSRPDFSRAFKEVLDIRQAERLMYLQLHPLMAGLELRDLEAASEVLGLAFFPPGTRLWPLDEKDRCLYFLAEGQAKVKRGGGGAAAAAAAAAAAHEAASGADGTSTASPSMYDRYTISILGPGDIFGLPSSEQALALQLQQSYAANATASADMSYSPMGAAALGLGTTSGTAGGGGSPAATSNVLIESYSQVKVYTVKYSDYLRLPASVQHVLQAANAFRWSYYEGRIVGLARMDNRRRDARREQLRRHQNNAALQRPGGGAGGPMCAAAIAALELAERDRQLLGRVPLLSASVGAAARGSAGAAGGAEQHAASARRAAQAAAQQQDERARLQQRQGGGGGGVSDADADHGHESGLPSWALPAAGAGRLGGWAGPTTPTAAESGGLMGGEGGAAKAAQKQRAKAAGGLRPGGGDSRPKSRPSSADTVASVVVAGSVNGSASGDPSGAAGGAGASTSSARGLNPLLHRSANGKALLAVQAAQLSRVLDAERHQYGRSRRPAVQMYTNGTAEEYDGVEYDGDASGDEREAGPWARSCSGSCSDSKDGDLSSRSRRNSRPRPLPQPRTTQYLTCRADAVPPRHPPPPQPTLGLLPPTSNAFPRVQTYRNRQAQQGQPSHYHSYQQQQHQNEGVPDLGLDAEMVETEEPRSLIVAQTVRQRHMLLFQNAQSMVAAASHSRPWVKPARQPRPSYGRAARASQQGSGSGLSASDGGGGGACASADPRRSPTRTSASSVLPLPVQRFGAGIPLPAYDGSGTPLSSRTSSGGRRPVRPDDRLSRYGSMGRAGSAGAGRISSASSAGGGGSGADGGVVLPFLPADLPLPKPGFGRGSASAPAAAAAAAASSATSLAMAAELSFAHLGIQEVGDEDDSSGSGNGSEQGGGGGDGSDETRRYADMDDEALLARVPAALLGKGGRGKRGGGKAGGGKGGAGKERGEKGGAEEAPEGGVRGAQAQQPDPKDSPSTHHLQDILGAASTSTGSVAALQQQQQQRKQTGGNSGSGSAARGGSTGVSGAGATAVPPSASRVTQAGPGGPESTASAPAAAAATTGNVEGGGGGGGGGGLNFTMRRRGAGGSAAPAGAAAENGGGGGPSAANAAAGTAAAVASAGTPIPAGAGRNGTPLQASGRGGTTSGPRGPMDAEFPQDLDEKSLHSHYTHQQRGQASASGAHPHHQVQQHQQQHHHLPHQQYQTQHIAPLPSVGAPPPTARTGSSSATRVVPPSPPAHTHTRGEHAMADPNPAQAQSHSQPQTPPQHGASAASTQAAASSSASASPPPVGLPPGIALGYESLDPFAWAALAAQVGPSIRTPFSQENILPKPQW